MTLLLEEHPPPPSVTGRASAVAEAPPASSFVLGRSKFGVTRDCSFELALPAHVPPTTTLGGGVALRYVLCIAFELRRADVGATEGASGQTTYQLPWRLPLRVLPKNVTGRRGAAVARSLAGFVTPVRRHEPLSANDPF